MGAGDTNEAGETEWGGGRQSKKMGNYTKARSKTRYNTRGMTSKVLGKTNLRTMTKWAKFLDFVKWKIIMSSTDVVLASVRLPVILNPCNTSS